jgi:hypothetical protein
LLALTTQNAFELDLANLTVRSFWRSPSPGGDSGVPQDGLVVGEGMKSLFEVSDDWVWTAFSRYRRDGSRREELPYLRPMDMGSYTPKVTLMERLPGEQMLVADPCGMWLLDLKR